MKIIYISKYSSLTKKILKKFNSNIDFIDDLYPFKEINYTSNKDYFERSESIKNDLVNIIGVLKKHFNNIHLDLIEPDFVLEKGTLNNIQEILDKEHIINHINNNDIKLIIVRKLRDFFYIKREVSNSKLRKNIIYLPSLNSFFSFFRENKNTFFYFIKILIASTKSSQDINLNQDIIIDAYDIPFRRFDLYYDLIKAIKKSGKDFIFLSSIKQKKLLSLGNEYKSIDILRNISLYRLIKLYIKNIPNLLKLFKEIVISKKFKSIPRFHLLTFFLVYVLFDFLPKIEFDRTLKHIRFSNKKTILIPALDYLKNSRIISRNFKNNNSNLKTLRLPLHDFPYGIKNPFYEFYNTNYDYIFLAFPNQNLYSNNLNSTNHISTIGIPKEIKEKRSLNDGKFSLIIDVSPFGNGYYTPASTNKLIKLIKKIETLSYLDFIEIILVFHPSCETEFIESISTLFNFSKNFKIVDFNTSTIQRKKLFNNSDLIICFSSTIGFSHLLLGKSTIIFKQITSNNFKFIDKIYKNTYQKIDDLFFSLKEELDNLNNKKNSNLKFSTINKNISDFIIPPEKYIENLASEIKNIFD